MRQSIELIITSRIGIGGAVQDILPIDRDRVPPELLLLHHDVVETADAVPLPLHLWQRTHDEFVHFYRNQKRHRDALALRRRQIKTLPTLPFVVLVSMCFKHQFLDADGDQVWRTWIGGVLLVPVLHAMVWLLQRYYVVPVYRGLESEWHMFAHHMQQQYEAYGITIRIQRSAEVLPDLTKALPHGQLPCGLILEVVRNNVDDGATAVAVPDAVMEPTTGIPATLWQDSVRECKQLHEDQAHRIKAAMDASFSFANYTFVVPSRGLFATAPFWTWLLGWTDNRHIVYVAYGCMCFGVLSFVGMIFYLRFGSAVGPLVRCCDDEWRALAARVRPQYGIHAVAVAIQTRPIVVPDPLRSFFDGPAAHVVGLSFRRNGGHRENDDDEVICTIEDGKVVWPPEVAAEESPATAETQAAMQVPLIESELT
jgi:hypothetical protein